MSDTPKEEKMNELERLQQEVRELNSALAASAAQAQKLNEAADFHRLVIENVRDLIWTMDLDLKYTYMSPSIKEIRGYTPEEALELSVEESTTPESLNRLMAGFQSALKHHAKRASGKDDPRVVEFEVRCKDGSTRWMEGNMTFLRDDSGKPIQLLGVGRDITERKLAEADLQKWGHVFETATWGIEIFGADGSTLQRVNRASAELHGYTIDEILLLTRDDLFPPEAHEKLQVSIAEANAEGFCTFQSTRKRKDGTLFPVSIHASIARDAKGEVLYHVMHVQDLTEQEHGERALLRASRMEATATLAGGVAHDFNNLMVSVLGNASLLRMQLPHDDSCAQMLREIESAAEQAAALSQQMLAFARGGKYQPVVMNLNHTLRDALKLQARTLPPRIHIQQVLAHDLWNVYADSSQMTQIIVNLCLNAVDATEANGQVRFTTENVSVDREYARAHKALRPGRYVRLSVEDFGEGMDEETLSRAFEPFFTTRSQGRGLGLSAIYGIVKNHDGYIYGESEVDTGTVFRLYLPATTLPLQKTREPRSVSTEGGETVLLIDDEKAVVNVARNILERLGYNVVCASNGREALKVAQTFDGEIDIAVLDMGMPEMGGAETFPLLLQARPNIKVIICSGYDLDEDAQALLDSGADAFLRKPFTPSELGAEIQKVLNS